MSKLRRIQELNNEMGKAYFDGVEYVELDEVKCPTMFFGVEGVLSKEVVLLFRLHLR